MRFSLLAIILLTACGDSSGPGVSVDATVTATGAPGCEFSWRGRVSDRTTTVTVSIMELDTAGTNTIVPLPGGVSGGMSSYQFADSLVVNWSGHQSTVAVRWRLALANGVLIADDTSQFPQCRLV